MSRIKMVLESLAMLESLFNSEEGVGLSVAQDDGDEQAAEKILRRNCNDDWMIQVMLDTMFNRVVEIDPNSAVDTKSQI